ncbi:acetyltransferase [Winogradskyella eckloniae]|uniref:acetyltransferase n=1 Tax=Winogradskyella eckloniae TaxID=1089306 RepID=UPI001563AB90|nr:acetyltransferase [Winogradskyella eckloniae]NRD19936.1 acetyltransferase [Winogradskyella eckloniae]
MKNILIYGASGHAKMIIDIIEKNKSHAIKGFIDSYKPIGLELNGYTILGHLEDLQKVSQEHKIDGIVVAIGDNFKRKNIVKAIEKATPNLQFFTVIHPTATLAQDISIDVGTVIMANTVINAGAKVGKQCIINTASTLGHDSILDDFSSLASGVTIAGNVSIGKCSAIGLRAIVIQSLTIGNNTVIGAGSLVLKSIGHLKTAFGNPIHTVKNRNEDSPYLG